MDLAAFFGDGFLLTAALVWGAFACWLFFLTRGFNRGLAWTFLILGFTCPPAMLYATTTSPASLCDETIMNSGHSADGVYSYEILQRRCHNVSNIEFEVRLGRAGHLEPLHTVYESDHFSKPLSVTRRGRHEFSIVLESRGAQTDYNANRPIIVRMDPNTGLPKNFHTYRWRTGKS